MNRGLIVAVEGLMGVGKSTLTKSLCELCHYTPFNEPVDSNPFLTDYYANPDRWAYAMQVNLLWERFKMFQEANYRSLYGEVCIADRSLYGDMAFALVQNRDGYFNAKEFESYKGMHEVVQSMIPFPDLMIWLDLSVEDTYKRIQKRSRDCESGIQLEYLEHLNDAYQNVLKALEGKTKIIKVNASPSADIVLYNVMNIINSELNLTQNIVYR